MNIGHINQVVNENGKLIYRQESHFNYVEGTLANAVADGSVSQDEVDAYQKEQMIFSLHQELHDIYKQVTGFKKRAEDIKAMLKTLGCNTDSLLTKPLPPRPVPPKKQPKDDNTPPTNNNSNGKNTPPNK